MLGFQNLKHRSHFFQLILQFHVFFFQLSVRGCEGRIFSSESRHFERGLLSSMWMAMAPRLLQTCFQGLVLATEDPDMGVRLGKQ